MNASGHPRPFDADHEGRDHDHGHDLSPANGFVPRRGRPSVAEAVLLAERILEASWQVLLEHGFENFSFDRIARHARIGKATIYSRFSGKTELMRALLAWRMARQRAEILAESDAMEPLAAFTLRAQRVLEALLSADGVLMERLIDWVDLEAGAGNVRAEVYRSALQSIADEFAAMNAAGSLAIADVDRAARFWLEGLLGHARLAASEGEQHPAERQRWASDYADYFFRGVDAWVTKS